MPRERAYALLHDPAVLARCMPGCESLEKIGEDEYAMRMKMVLASVSGLFQGKVRTSEPNPPESFRLLVEGAGQDRLHERRRPAEARGRRGRHRI